MIRKCYPVVIYLLKANNRNTRTRYKICSKLTIKTPHVLVFLLLKLVSAIFDQIFIFSPNNSPSKTTKSVFYFISKALFSRYSNFFSSFPHFPDTKGRMEVA